MKRFTYLLIVFFTLITLKTKAQNWQWLKDIETSQSSFLEKTKSASDINGNTFVAGNYGELMMGGSLFIDNTTLNSSGGSEHFLVKYNADGSLAWAKSFGTTGPDEFEDIACDAAGNVYVAGIFSSTLTIGTTSITGNQNDFFLAKFNSSGVLQWLRQSNEGLSMMGFCSNINIATDASNNCYVTGAFTETVSFGSGANAQTLTSVGNRDVFMLKYNSSGTKQWVKSAGGAGSEVPVDVVALSNGNVQFSGVYSADFPMIVNGNALSSYGGQDIFLAVYTTNGGFTSSNSFGSVNDDYLVKAQADNASSVYLVGYFGGPSGASLNVGSLTLNTLGSFDVFAVKINSNNGYVWAKSGGSASSDVCFDAAFNSTTNKLYISLKVNNSATYGSLTLNSGNKVLTYNADGVAINYINLGTYGGDTKLTTWDNSISVLGKYMNSFTLGSQTVNFTPGNNDIAYYLARYNDEPPAQPSITSFYPQEGVVGSSVIIKGLKFTGALAVQFEGVSTTYNVVNDSTILAVVPVNASTGKISISLPNSITLTSTNNFTVRTLGNLSYAWQWAVQSTNTSSLKTVADAAVDNNGSVITVGSYKESFTFGTNTITSLGGYDAYIIKNDVNGNLLWIKGIGSAAGDDEAKGVSTDAFGNIYVSGYFTGTISIGNTSITSAGAEDIFILKFSPDGALIWAKAAGGTDRDQAFDIKVDALGNSYFTGRFYGTATVGGIILNTYSTYAKTFTAKFDANGNGVWAKEATSTADNYGNSICFDGNGNCYVMGYFSIGMNFGGTSITARVNNIDYFLVKYNATGVLQWAKRIDGDFIANLRYMTHIVADAAGNILIAGCENVSNTKTTMLAKYTSDGNLVWKKTGSSSGQNHAYDIALGSNGEITIIGQLSTPLTFDNITIDIQSAFGSEMYVARFDNQGNALASYQPINTSTNTENGFAIAMDAYNNVYTAGFFSGTPAFGSTTLNSSTSDVYVAKITSNALSVNNQKVSQLVVYPNPVIGSTLFIKNADDATYEIYNTMGQLVQRGTIENSSINVSALSSGLYILKTEKGFVKFEI